MNEAQTIADGAQAEQAMRVLDPAIETVRKALLEALVKTAPDDVDKVLALHRTTQTLDAVRKAIQDVIDNGKLTAAAINGLS